MNFLKRLPRPRDGWASPLAFLEITEEEYRAWLKERGYSEHAIENELRELDQARQRHDLPGAPQPKKEETGVSALFDRLVKRRARGADGKEKR